MSHTLPSGAPKRGAIHSFLRGEGRDGRGRLLAEVLSFDDRAIEGVHDFIQWLFPLPEPSRAVPGSPVLQPGEAEAIRGDARAVEGFRAGLERMGRFYGDTDGWLVRFDHNHLRISRILRATRAILGQEAARAFHAAVAARNQAAGAPINDNSLRHWQAALR
ncbi:opioid growth factor receptor-related protein [Roseomonas elaeocarpi]|uniref:Opioid growth factor receptor-related protein n=1 Tax=Roseomonas elaeocarpi TaxID=907779 RepID=A0ABV6JYC9_9PROT